MATRTACVVSIFSVIFPAFSCVYCRFSAAAEIDRPSVRLHVERMGKIDVQDSNVEAYRELEAAGLVLPGRPFVGEPRYHLTRAGYELKLENLTSAKEIAC